MDRKKLEKYTSAITLSDMEIFVFPELMYSLVLANIMSPIIWRWREEKTFKKLKGKTTYRKLMRLKQYIMDEYEFNLDLNTWGLTDKNIEIKRFDGIIEPKAIEQSNALFGYTGDKYYFDVDIRRHFGLDKYEGDIIPYWKTETIEAMSAFRLKDGYRTGAGECVSLAALYAAAAFVVCEIPLEDIYMILTPLHSQNYLDLRDGVITNNRRIVTKSMWFNGTEISNKAQRALRNERVTIVAHNSGWIHCMYDEATIDPKAYKKFKGLVKNYLRADMDQLMLANFLRSCENYHQYFQFCTKRRGEAMFINAEDLYRYEHDSSNRIYDESFDKLLEEVDEEDYHPTKLSERLCCEQFLSFMEYENIDLYDSGDREKVQEYLKAYLPNAEDFLNELYSFIHIEPRLPGGDKKFSHLNYIEINPEMGREGIIEYLASIRENNSTADLAFYTYRDMDNCDWQPFIKAALERCPVSIEAAGNRDNQAVCQWLCGMTNASIYDDNRLAQPDEVVNYQHGDGIEKALTLANIIRSRDPEQKMELDINGEKVTLKADADYNFKSAKNFTKSLKL